MRSTTITKLYKQRSSERQSSRQAGRLGASATEAVSVHFICRCYHLRREFCAEPNGIVDRLIYPSPNTFNAQQTVLIYVNVLVSLA